VVVDAEAIFRIDPPPEQSLVGALITDLLPHTGILFVTVLEALSLLRGAGIPTEHPKGLSDLKSMGHALQRLGATNVVIKTETFDAPDQMTALQYVFCGESGEKMDRDYLYNPSGFFGASYSIPCKSSSSNAIIGHTGGPGLANSNDSNCCCVDGEGSNAS
jgi:hydroxymethylpyrimidine/phosphomethylpyrimidine kinase